MSGPPPVLIVTLAARGVDDARREAAEAAAAGGDLAEVRLDRWPAAERARSAELFPAAIPLMATLRSSAEGGEGPDDPAARNAILSECLRLPFRWIDLEDDRDAPELAARRAGGETVFVRSAHLAEGTSTDELLARLRRAVPPGEFRKLVLPATVHRLLEEILPSIEAAPVGATVLLTTGPSGPLLRAWADRLRYPFVFAAPPAASPGAVAAPVEPSQIPVDRLRRFYEGGNEAPLFAVVGRPVAHSLSPWIHSRWIRAAGRPGLYVALEMRSESEFVESIETLAHRGFRGLNVTHPWKTTALACATRVGRGAELCGVANCLTLRDDEVEAENTDLAAILRRIEEVRAGRTGPAKELLVVGTGGAAAATLAATRELGLSAFVLGRSRERTEALAGAFGATPVSPEELRAFPLVVHATDIGRGTGRQLELPIERALGPESHVIDWVYAPDDATVARRARGAGAQYEDGWRLLVYQAAISFGLWWGAEPAPGEVARTIEEGPCAA